MDLSVHRALGSDPFDPHDISWLGGVSLRCSTVLAACNPVRGARSSTWLWAGHDPEKRTFYITSARITAEI